jgi:ATP-binding protein involved in chromosome partitioning
MYKPRDIGRVIVVGAGKGGVGKSTVTAQFAHYLAEQNIRVGVIDADIHQPSLTRMLGIGAQEIRAVDNKIVPAKHSNISMLSLGFWVAESNAVVWSSSMGIELLRQFVDGAWDDCDVILVDLPPGTGEIQSALLQMIEVHRVVLVATPQCVAIDGVRRFARMVDVLGIPVAGFVANMSRECPVEIDGCTQLASVSYDPEIADACDKGVRSKSLEIAQMCRVMHGLL